MGFGKLSAGVYFNFKLVCFFCRRIVNDNEAPIPSLLNLFLSVEFPTNLIFETLQTITSEVGEKYRLLAQRVRGGVNIVGVDIEEPTNSSCAECLDQRLHYAQISR